jgi:Protein of unknown function (DUF1501)
MEMHDSGCSVTLPGSGGSRREFLRKSAITLSSLAVPELLRRPVQAAFQPSKQAAVAPLSLATHQNKSVLFVVLPGGPSQLDMYDMKPNAPANIRGEFRPINTNVPGIRVCEHLPLHAKIADKFAIVNGVEMVDEHDKAVISAAADRSMGARLETLALTHGRPEPGGIEMKSRQSVTLPHGDWDTHGRVLGRQLTIFEELREKLPAYDQLLHGLITDIYDRGLDQDVMIVACGEFGRAPWVNEHGGRNHWSPSGSVLFAGGGLKVGQVIGDTGPIGERERLRSQPYTAGNIYATIFRHLGFDGAMLWPGAQPIAELI